MATQRKVRLSTPKPRTKKKGVRIVTGLERGCFEQKFKVQDCLESKIGPSFSLVDGECVVLQVLCCHCTTNRAFRLRGSSLAPVYMVCTC